MTYRRIRKAKFFVDEITARINRGRDITDFSNDGRAFNTGCDQYDLIDLDPYNVATWDTSAVTDDIVSLGWNSGLSSANGHNFLAILNHNLDTAQGMIRISSHTSAPGEGEGTEPSGISVTLNGSAADVDTGQDLTATMSALDTSFTVAERAPFVVGHKVSIGDEIFKVTSTGSGAGTVGVTPAATNTHASGTSVYFTEYIVPATNGDTLIEFTASSQQYWQVEFVPEDGDWSATDLQVGAVMLGRTYTTPVSPDMSISTGYNYGGVSVRETVAGKRHAYASWLTGNVNDGSAIYQPFARGTGLRQYGGRFYADLSFSYMADTDIFPSDMSAPGIPNTNILSDVVLRSIDGAHRPFITLLDSTSTTEGDFIWGRLVNNSLQLNQVSTNTYTASFRIEQEI